MTEIKNEHVEWAIVDRLRQMLRDTNEFEFNVTRTYSLFASTLCWSLQRIRSSEAKTEIDNRAGRLLVSLENESVAEAPWNMNLDNQQRRINFHDLPIRIPPPIRFDGHMAMRFLINLRDAAAHGDARNVTPFNFNRDSKRVLAGFTFRCEERRVRQTTWTGQITLLESDMKRIAISLADKFCDSLSGGSSNFVEDVANNLLEAAA